MTATLDDVQTADSRITAPPPPTVEDAARVSGDSAGSYVPSGAAETAGLLVVEGRFSIVPEWLLDADVSDAAVRLYAVLLRFGATSGQRMPSRRTLANRLRKKSVDSVDRAMKELVAIGAVEVSHRSRDGVNLTNRYLVRSTPPGQPTPRRRGRGGRTDGATPDVGSRPGNPSACSHDPEDDVRLRTGGRRSAATSGRTDAARVAAQMRPNREFFTETNPPPQPSTRPAVPRRPGRDRAGDEASVDGRAARRSRVLELVGVADLDDVAAVCSRLRRDLGRPAGLWTADRLADVLAAAILDAGWPATNAVPALLAIAADPATRSPARLSCPGTWWEITPDREAAHWNSYRAADLVAGLEAVLAETGGLRVALQRQARDQLTAEGVPLTRGTVARRAVDLLRGQQARPEKPSRLTRMGRDGSAGRWSANGG